VTKYFQTTITTQWDIHGDVTEKDINEYIERFLNVVMMTPTGLSGGWAFHGAEDPIIIHTKEVKI
jgi:hypothetical protein